MLLRNGMCPPHCPLPSPLREPVALPSCKWVGGWIGGWLGVHVDEKKKKNDGCVSACLCVCAKGPTKQTCAVFDRLKGDSPAAP